MTALIELASFIIRLGSLVRNTAYDLGWIKSYEPPLLTISVGNISFGGTGKTPLALFLLSFFKERGWKPCFLSRGYRGQWEKKGGIVSDGQKIFANWQEAGDEPFMVARKMPDIPVIVGRNRYSSSLLATKLGCQVAVFDDAFQHRRLKRHLDIVLVGLRNRGLRESWAALKRANIILVQGKKDLIPTRALKTIMDLKKRPALFAYKLVPTFLYLPRSEEKLSPNELKMKKIVAFCGLASPQSFRLTLEELGASIAAFLAFPDHHPYPRASLEKIGQMVEAHKPDWLVTTEKDAVKLLDKAWFLNRYPLAELKIEFSAEPGFISVLEELLQDRKNKLKI